MEVVANHLKDVTCRFEICFDDVRNEDLPFNLCTC